MIEDNLKRLGIVLPIPPKPAGSYVPVVVSGNLAFVSGQIPIQDGKVMFTGKVPTEKSIQEAQQAARLCAINILAQLRANLGSLERITRILRVSGFVNSDAGFSEQPKIINAASDFLFEIFGESGKHSRIAIGASSLPLNSTVEIDMIAEISTG
ncbi:RidA family protein [Candidatus Nitrosotenuis uzonensis]|uniref:Endoribonuclease L-PSP n=1 Tax=Candidatus Nitrosotenuis uzonensis TaxID=1407055 RepID=A0A812F2F4_9ARCH|nr:RidA family protein [Candidatus Nitrosotenuis uzonensis]CAE6497381.1 Endoribonuclease L-PSP [Candidatus Nitrosotenuis uzonensis]